MYNKRIRLAIIHYSPLEYYPPIMNLLDYLCQTHFHNFASLEVFTCKNNKKRIPYLFENLLNTDKAYCYRSPFPNESDNILIRLIKYLHFNFNTLCHLIINRPTVLLYFESISAWPAYIYTRYINRNCSIFIHNHEYASKEWYANTMKQIKFFHILEKKWLYPRAIWNSQTNADRLLLFSKDHPYLKKENLKIMPNYPPQVWSKHSIDNNNINNQIPLKIVYIGSLSFQHTYLEEFCNWIATQNGKLQFDIYAYNLDENVKFFLKNLNLDYINYFEQGIEYYEQPNILTQYQVGMILYKAHNDNFTYNAPNKLFEYLACNLDIWYPNVLKGSPPYLTQNAYPKVIPLDFENLERFVWELAIDRTNLKYKPSIYFCEPVYKELIENILEA